MRPKMTLPTQLEIPIRLRRRLLDPPLRPLRTARSVVKEKAVKMPMLNKKWEARRIRRETFVAPDFESIFS